jgi:DnaJ-domain-containing protein 1
MPKSDYDGLWRSVLGAEPDDREAADTRSSEDTDSDASGYEEGYEEPIVPPDLATYYATILGIPLTASPQEVKRAYREKAKQYHPDVVAHKGPVFAREAEERFKELSKAYAFFRGSAMAT